MKFLLYYPVKMNGTEIGAIIFILILVVALSITAIVLSTQQTTTNKNSHITEIDAVWNTSTALGEDNTGFDGSITIKPKMVNGTVWVSGDFTQTATTDDAYIVVIPDPNTLNVGDYLNLNLATDVNATGPEPVFDEGYFQTYTLYQVANADVPSYVDGAQVTNSFSFTPSVSMVVREITGVGKVWLVTANVPLPVT